MLDITSANSIIEYAKKLKDKSLREVCGEKIEQHNIKGKGSYGNLVEKYYFGYEPNSISEADFPDAGLELKTTPLKATKKGEYRAKERLVLNIINYLEVYKEDFESSTFWKKNAHLLIIFYLYESGVNKLDYIIKLIDEWRYPEVDLKIIRSDWETINSKIKEGKAHELSEGDTMYLGACTKGSTAKKSYRAQPFNKKKAKQRAYSLKQGYLNHIIGNIANEESEVYGRILDSSEILNNLQSLESIVISKFKPFYGKSSKEIENEFGLTLNRKAKNYYANLTKAILGIGLDKKIEEFEKADIITKTIRLKENYIPKESVSFPAFNYIEILKNDWEDSEFKHVLESKFFFVFYQFQGSNLILRKVQFWNMPSSDILEAKKVWKSTVNNISNGKIVKSITPKGKRNTFFTKKTENRVSHVRPHAQNKNDTFPLPVADKFTGATNYTKHSFWLNAEYIKKEIFER